MALTDKITAIADAIRGKTGKTDSLTLDQMATEIDGIVTSAQVVTGTFTISEKASSAGHLTTLEVVVSGLPFKPKHVIAKKSLESFATASGEYHLVVANTAIDGDRKFIRVKANNFTYIDSHFSIEMLDDGFKICTVVASFRESSTTYRNYIRGGTWDYVAIC